MSKVAPVLCFAVIAVAAAGCSSAGTSASACGTFISCGGNLAGTWTIQAGCLTGEFAVQSCKTAKVDLGDVTFTGSSTFDGAAGTYSSNWTEQGKVAVTFPASCLNTGATDCKALEQNLMQELTAAGAGAPFAAVTCAAAGDGCTCTETLKPFTDDETGKFTIMGNLVTLNPVAGEAETLEYCATATELRIGQPGNANPGTPSEIPGTILFTRK